MELQRFHQRKKTYIKTGSVTCQIEDKLYTTGKTKNPYKTNLSSSEYEGWFAHQCNASQNRDPGPQFHDIHFLAYKENLYSKFQTKFYVNMHIVKKDVCIYGMSNHHCPIAGSVVP